MRPASAAFLKLVFERESASVSGTAGDQSLGVFKSEAIIVLFVAEAFKSVLQP
ncbi:MULTISPECIES: hypothetical protein [unclassified Agrobacterium]|uniref:hypothetical protein n=1 Tax=unclassified Agrobacterium TaxID=2632611 RepID=UPI0035C06507